MSTSGSSAWRDPSGHHAVMVASPGAAVDDSTHSPSRRVREYGSASASTMIERFSPELSALPRISSSRSPPMSRLRISVYEAPGGSSKLRRS